MIQIKKEWMNTEILYIIKHLTNKILIYIQINQNIK